MADVINDERLAELEGALISSFGERAIIICSGQRVAALPGSPAQKTWGDLELRLKAHFQKDPRPKDRFLNMLKVVQSRVFRTG
jgi:hypothetical protein